MKNITGLFDLSYKICYSMLFLFLLSAIAGCDDPAGGNSEPEVPQTQEGGWKLVWHDEFSGSRIDTQKWGYDIGTGAEEGLDGWGNNELQYYTNRSQNAEIREGKLVITARQEDYEGRDYTSARLVSRGKVSWLYGRIEIKARLPEGQGLWPAVWMLPAQNTYGGWPQSGELDIMELLGHQPHTVHGTVHYGEPWPDNSHKGSSYTRDDSSFADSYNEFQIDWTPDSIKWYVNDRQFYSITPDSLQPHRYPFDHPFYLLLNVAVGGNWPGSPDASTQFPQTMSVEYVRVYQQEQYGE